MALYYTVQYSYVAVCFVLKRIEGSVLVEAVQRRCCVYASRLIDAKLSDA